MVSLTVTEANAKLEVAYRESGDRLHHQFPKSHHHHFMPCKDTKNKVKGIVEAKDIAFELQKPACKITISLKKDTFAKYDDAPLKLPRQMGMLRLLGASASAHDQPPQQKFPQRKRLTFHCQNNVVFVVERFNVPQAELWWSNEEIQASRNMGKICATVEPAALEYCKSFDRAFRQVHTERKLSAAYLSDLVKGLSLGYRGLEQHCASNERKNMIREHASSVIKCYEKRGLNNNSNDSVYSGNSRSTGSSSSSSSFSSSSQARNVRNLSTNLSAGNRHFAVALAKAERMALH